MNLIEKWKSRETKKKLKEENIRLKAELESLYNAKSSVCTIERNIQKIGANYMMKPYDPTSIEEIKNRITYGLINEVSRFIDWDIRDGYDIGEKNITGYLYVATGDRKYEYN